MSTLPLKAISRLWGRFNELEIPYYLRVPGFKLYSWIFGVKCVTPGTKEITGIDKDVVVSPRCPNPISISIRTLRLSSTER